MMVWFDRVRVDGVADDADGRGALRPSGVAVGTAAFSSAGRAASWPCGDEVGGLDQLRAQVGQGAGQSRRGERAARVAESRAASAARLKLTRPGSRPGGAARAIRSRIAW